MKKKHFFLKLVVYITVAALLFTALAPYLAGTL